MSPASSDFSPRAFTSSRITSSRLNRFENQLPDTLGLWVNALRSGYSVLQSMEAIARDAPEPTATEFKRVVQEVQLASTWKTRLSTCSTASKVKTSTSSITAVNIQREVGGNLAEILDVISHTIRERIKLKGEIRVLTAQGRITGYLISVLPIILALFLYTINPGYMGNLFENRICGWPMLGIGLGADRHRFCYRPEDRRHRYLAESKTMEPIIVLAVVIIGTVVFGGLVYVGTKEDRGRDPLQERLAQYEDKELPQSLEEIELSLSFRDRVLLPLMRQVAQLTTKFTPQKQLEEARHQIELAGMSMDPATFFAMRIIVTIVFGLGAFFVFFVGSHNTAPGNALLYTLGAVALGYFLPVTVAEKQDHAPPGRHLAGAARRARPAGHLRGSRSRLRHGDGQGLREMGKRPGDCLRARPARNSARQAAP